MKKFLSSSFLLVIGTLIMSAVNYAYNLFINRLLLPADFATYSALLGLLAMVLVPIGAVQTVAAKYSAEFVADNDPGRVWILLVKMTRRLLPVCLILFLLVLLFPKPVASFINAGDSLPVLRAVSVMAFAFLFQLMLPVNRGILQGTQRFLALALNYLSDALARFIFGLLLLLPLTGQGGWSALQAISRGELKLTDDWAVALGIAATIIGSFVSYLLSWLPVRRYRRPPRQPKLAISTVLRFSLPTLLMVIFLAVLFNIDVVMIKRFSLANSGISPDNAGEYATISTLAKLIFYITGPIVAVMFPMISDLVKRGKRHYLLLLTTMLAVTASSLVVLGIFAAAPTAIINILTPNYAHVAYLLVPMTVIFVIYSLINVLSNYFLSLNDYRFLWPLGFFALAEIAVLQAGHGSMSEVVTRVVAVQTALLAALLGFYLWLKRERFFSLIRSSNS